MKRFLMLVGVAVVAAAMYVAASPASQQAGPTAKQFAALKKQVAALSKKVKSTQTDVDTLAFAYVHCSLPSEIGVAQFTVGTGVHTTALDLESLNPTSELTPFNSSDTVCQSLIGAAAGSERHFNAARLARTFARKP